MNQLTDDLSLPQLTRLLRLWNQKSVQMHETGSGSRVTLNLISLLFFVTDVAVTAGALLYCKDEFRLNSWQEVTAPAIVEHMQGNLRPFFSRK